MLSCLFFFFHLHLDHFLICVFTFLSLFPFSATFQKNIFLLFLFLSFIFIIISVLWRFFNKNYFFVERFINLFFAETMAGQHYCLRWNNYQSNMTSVFHQLLQNEAFVDVTLACNDLSLKAHKVGMSIIFFFILF